LQVSAQFAAMKRGLYLLPALGYMGLIFWMSSYPSPEALKHFPIFGVIKLVHLVEYGILALFWVWGLAHAFSWHWWRITSTSALITFFWGISDEMHQSFVPGRTACLADALTDLLAALLAIGMITFIRGRKTKLWYKPRFIKDEEAL